MWIEPDPTLVGGEPPAGPPATPPPPSAPPLSNR
jgi:hypothetical protein